MTNAERNGPEETFHDTERKLRDRVEALELALTQSRAETAAAYEWAEEWGIHKDGCRFYDIAVCDCGLSTLSTPDQTAALDAVRAEARAQGMRKAASSIMQAAVFNTDATDKENATAVIVLGRVQKHILAAIKGDKA